MRSTNADLKARARHSLIGKYGVVILAYLISDVVSYMLSALLPAIAPSGTGLLDTLQLILCIFIIFMLSMILSVGSNYLYLNIARERPYRLSDIFYCFTHQPDRIILVSLALFLINLLCLAPIFIGMFALIFFLPEAIFDVFSLQLALGFCLLILIVALVVNLRYFLVYFLCVDYPELGTREILRKSVSLMRGYKRKALWMILSFLGMGLLCILSFGLGTLWVQPYFSMTLTHFYLDAASSDHYRWS